jgi:hypothetical protein
MDIINNQAEEIGSLTHASLASSSAGQVPNEKVRKSLP